MYMTPDWTALIGDVTRKILLLREAWDHTAQVDAALHEKLKQDLYVPLITLLAQFCLGVEEKVDQGDD
jgi:hypothetical protein